MSAVTALDFAQAQRGTAESPHGSNKGPKITQWEIDSGYPWVANAAAGVPWCQCFANAGARAGGAPLIPDGFTPDFLSGKYAAKGYKPIPLADAEPGDFVYFKWPGVSSAICDHVGILVSKTATTVTCIEGNTSGTDVGSQNNGGGVYLRTRSRTLVAGAVSVPYPTPNAYRNLTIENPPLRGDDVRAFQKAANKVADQAGRDDRKSTVDGEYGPETRENGAWAAFLLGIGDSTAELKSGGISPYVQNLVRNPADRNQVQKDRGTQRLEAHSG